MSLKNAKDTNTHIHEQSTVNAQDSSAEQT